MFSLFRIEKCCAEIMDKKYIVTQSAIHGKGLIATHKIVRGTVIGNIEGKVTREDGPYVLWLTDEIGMEVENDFRYINHSPQPNAAYMNDATVEALRDIEPGEEITHDYSGDGQGEEW